MKRNRKGSIWSKRLRDYRYTDKKKGYVNDLTLEGVRALISLPCYYCGKPDAGGLDRLDNDKGHEIKNVVSACANCNYILSTLPYKAKMQMREALRIIYENDFLKDWQPIFMTPTKNKIEPKNALILLEGENETQRNDDTRGDENISGNEIACEEI